MAAGKYGTLLLCGNFRDLLLIFLKRCLEHTLRVYGTGFGSHQPWISFYIFNIHCLSVNRHYYCILPGNITPSAGVYNWTLQIFCKMPGQGLGKLKYGAGVAKNQLLHRLFDTPSPWNSNFCKSLTISNNVPRTCVLAFQRLLPKKWCKMLLLVWFSVENSSLLLSVEKP